MENDINLSFYDPDDDEPKSKGIRNNLRPMKRIIYECDFCSWRGTKDELRSNGHCPECMSPSAEPIIQSKT